MSGWSDVGDVVVTADFEESQGRTRLTLHQLFPSKEALEGALASGMERGMRMTLDQLDELVASLRSRTFIDCRNQSRPRSLDVGFGLAPARNCRRL